MPDINGISYSKEQILQYTGNMSRIMDARKMTYTEGRMDGVQLIEVTNTSGFNFTVLPSRSLDISRASYKNIPVAFQTSSGESSPYFYQPKGFEWVRNFFGGLLTTCGMTYSSHPCIDNGEELGLHGRISNIPAENVNILKKWVNEDYEIKISGLIRESRLFGENLSLNRTITSILGQKKICIEDIVTNDGYKETPIMMLYHINIGWPFLSKESKFVAPSISRKYADTNAESEPDLWDSFDDPSENYNERVYFHEMKENENGIVNVVLLNNSISKGIYLKYPKQELPHFIEWKMLGKGEYVVGIEPGNITGNRAQMRKDGTLEFIQPGKERKFSIEIGILDGKDEIEIFTNI